MAEGIQPVIIKKYANRRLYDTSTSKYIVLTDIVRLVENGVAFRVEDAKSGEDMTRSVLNQIIFEKETQSGEFFFPLDFQKQLIRFYNDTYRAMVPDYLSRSMAFFTERRNAITDDMARMMADNAKAFMEVSQDITNQNLEIMGKTWSIFLPTHDNDRMPEEEADAPTLEALQNQVDALQEQLKALKSDRKS